MDKQKGSITLEGAISTLVLMAVILTFSSFMKIVYVHGVMQHALIQTAGEIAQYSYIYSLSGLNEVNNAVATQGSQGSAAVSAGIDEVEGFLEEIGNGSLVQPDMDNLDPKTMITSLAKALAGEVYSTGKTVMLNHLVAMPLLKSYLPRDMDTFFAKNNVVQDGEFAGIDLGKSRYFMNADGYDEIELVAVYQMKVISPIPILQEVTLVQSAKSRAFFSAKKYVPPQGEEEEIDISVWELGDFERAEVIVKRENIPNNMPLNFPAIRGFDEKTGVASNYNTIDLNREEYHNNGGKMGTALKRKLKKIQKFENAKQGDVSVDVQQIKAVDYYVVIPKDVSPEDYALFQKEVRKLGDTIQLSDDRKVKLNIYISQVE